MGSTEKSVRVELGDRSYDIRIAEGLLDRIDGAFDAAGIGNHLFVVSNPRVWEMFGEGLLSRLESTRTAVPILIGDGERHKTLDTVESVYAQLLEHEADRSSTVVAVGGGVTGDIAGFAAATYMRGLPWVQIPTTLLAQVDSSVGGKTGVNFRMGKNLLGAFHQPASVCIDPSTLSSLDDRQYRSGLYEVVKYSLIRSRAFFEYLSERLPALLERDPQTVGETIAWSCRIKAEVVSADELEHGLRRILNLGHTFGHALEAATGYAAFTHGEAVGQGMKAAAALSRDLKMIDSMDAASIGELIDAVGDRPDADAVDFDQLWDCMTTDKKRAGGRLRFTLLNAVGGAAVVEEPSKETVRKAWNSAVAASHPSAAS